MKTMKFSMWLTSLTLLLLAGCSSGTTAVDNVPKSRGVDTDQTTEAVTLTFYDWYDEEPYMTAVIEAFEAEHPDIQIEAYFVPNDEHEQKMMVNLSTGEDMDVFTTQDPGNMAVYADHNTLEVLAVDEPEIAGVRALAERYRINGNVYGYPYRSGVWLLYYNQDIFDRAEEPYPDESWTWEHYAKVAARLARTSEQEPIYGSLSYPSTLAWWRIPANTSGANNPNDPNHREKLLEAAAYLHDLTYIARAQEPYDKLIGQEGSDYLGRFLQGQTAMMFNGEWAVEMLNRAKREDQISLHYNIAPLPYWSGEQPATTGTSTLIMVNRKSAHKEQAKKFAAFVASEKAAKIMAAHGILPAWTSASVQTVFANQLVHPEQAQVFFQREVLSQVPTDPHYKKSMQIMTDEVSLYLMRKQTLEQTRANIARRLGHEVR